MLVENIELVNVTFNFFSKESLENYLRQNKKSALYFNNDQINTYWSESIKVRIKAEEDGRAVEFDADASINVKIEYSRKEQIVNVGKVSLERSRLHAVNELNQDIKAKVKSEMGLAFMQEENLSLLKKHIDQIFDHLYADYLEDCYTAHLESSIDPDSWHIDKIQDHPQKYL
jgi:hypothetical protein